MVILVTKEGLKKLLDEKREIIEVKIPEVNLRLQHAREQGDLSENSAYTAAKEERENLEHRLDEIKELLANAEIPVVEEGIVGVGSYVAVISKDGKKLEFRLVGETEANPKERKISHKSPLGMLLKGRKKGDLVKLRTEDDEIEYQIVEVN